jgi:hypothetical protein
MTKTKLLFSFIIAVFLLVSVTSVLAEEGYRVQHVVEFSPEKLSFDRFQNYDRVVLEEASFISEVAKPMLPSQEIRIALPEGMRVTGVRVADTKSEDIPGDYYIFPAQPPRMISSSDRDFELIQPDPITYSSTQPYPAKPVKFVNQSDLTGQSIANIQFYPLQYVPAERKLTLYTSITIEIEGTGGYVCGDYLSPNISEKSREIYQQMLEDMVVNPEDVNLNTGFKMESQAPLPPGSYEHVIITSSSYASSFQPLIDWHIKRGLTDTVVISTDIYSAYSGGTNQEKVRNFIIDAQSTWGTAYFLIGGETQTVPFEYRTYYEDYTPSDQYYSDYDDDWTNEVFVGRIPVASSGAVTTFVNKVLKYEKDPTRTGYPLDVLLVGMDLDASTPCENLKESVDYYIPTRFNVTKVYDSHPTNHRTEVLNALNAGQNLVNHADHSNATYMGTGDFNHSLGISNSNVDALVNDNQMSVIVSLGCMANQMDYSDCIAEHFVEYNPSQAGVAFTGNTRHGWYSPGSPNDLSGTLDLQWWRGLFTRNKYRLGEILADSKHNSSHSSDTQKQCEWTFNLLGEPEMMVWTNEPDSFAVSFPSMLPSGTSSFTVHVESYTTAAPIYKAYVCLWKDGEIYLRAYTNTSGDFTFNLSPSTNGIMYVTVTKQDYIPYEGEATVASPAVSTNQATNMEETSATIHGYLEDDAGYEATCWLFWDTDSGEPYANSESLGVFANGSEFSKELSGLIEGAVHYFKAKAQNVAGWGEGEELMFITKPLSPTDLTAEAISCSTITLTWVRPSSADGVIIERNDSLFWERGEGVLVSNDTSESFLDSGLDPLTQYYYQAWSYQSEGELVQYSDDFDTAQTTTTFMLGDANADKQVSVSDVIYLINYLFKGGTAPIPMESGDANCDTDISVSDVIYLINYLFKSGPAPGC